MGDLDHTGSSDSETFSINKANATITVAGYSVTYDGNPHTARVSAVTGVNGEAGPTVGSVDVSATTHTAAGTYNADAWVFTGGANYNSTNGTVSDSIGLASLTVVAADAVRGYGATNPVFTVSYVGFVNGETNSALGGTLVVDSVADTNSPLGTYPITASGLTSADYQIGYQAGVLTVTNALLTLAANDTNKVYGQTVTFAGTEFAASGLLSTDSVSTVTLSSAGAVSNAPVNGGLPYSIAITNAVGDDGLTNYLITYVPGTLTVNPANATIAVTPYSVTYDGNQHTATVSATGALNEDLSGDVNLSGTTHIRRGHQRQRPLELHGPEWQLQQRQWHGGGRDSPGCVHDGGDDQRWTASSTRGWRRPRRR